MINGSPLSLPSSSAWRLALLTALPLTALTALTACGADELDPAAEAARFRTLEDGLLLHWTFEDSVGAQITDLSGNARHGTLKGGAALVASSNGQAVSLDGVDDWIALAGPRAPALYGGADGSFTLSARVKVSDASKYNTLCFGCGPFSTFYVGTEPYGPTTLVSLDDQSSTGWKWLASSPALVDDAWTEVTLVVENGSSARAYLDCQLDGQLDSANLGLIDVGSSSVGKGTAANRWFAGQIDELRLWNRALTGPELALLCPTNDPLAQDLELHWTFEDRVGDQILDMSGNGRNGTALNGAAFLASPAGESLSLDGVDDKVSFVGPRAPSIYGGTQGDFTLSARVKVADVNKYNTLCTGCGPFSTLYIGDPSPGARVQSALWNLGSQSTLWSTSTSLLTADTWTEITLVVEGGVAARTYADCTLDSTTQNPDLGLRDPGFSALGQGSAANRWYQGEVDELRVWSRALSDEELGLLCPQTNLCDGPIRVDVDAAPGGDGLSWATAFTDLQAAIDASVICNDQQLLPELWLAEGQYAPASTNQPVATIKHDIEIYGGFAGDELLRSQRDVAAHPVRLGADGWASRVVKIDDDNSPDSHYAAIRLDGMTISDSSAGALVIDSGAWTIDAVVTLENMTITDNVAENGAGLLTRAGSVTVAIRNSSFERNQVSSDFFGNGGAIWTRWTKLAIDDSRFIDNSADDYGGAIFFYELVATEQIADTVFQDNSASWGGAIFIDANPLSQQYIDFQVQGGAFIDNVASNGGGAIYAEESSSTLDGVLFTGNSGTFGGAILLADSTANAANDKLEISSCRFVANHALAGNGGALRLQEVGTTVRNSEFAGNQASTVGGAVYGRGDFVATTFANNVANSGSALYAPAGADMTMQHCVAYPDTIFGANIHGPYSCTTSVNLSDAPQTILTNTSPFAAADLDLDGLSEWYLDPDGPCVGLDAGVIDSFDWSSLTVDPSQCTDAGWPDPGVHYPPQAAVGACE